MFLASALKGYVHMVESSGKLDMLKRMPQRIEDGELINFNDKVILKFPFEIKDVEVLPKDDVGARFTDALWKRYLEGFNGRLLPLLEEKKDTEESSDPVEEEFGDILEAVTKGDARAARKALKAKKGSFDCDLDEFLDLIEDIMDAADDEDPAAAKQILKSAVVSEKSEPAPEKSEPAPEKSEEEDEDEDEVIVDLKSAIKDEDHEDAVDLLNELGEDHPRYEEFKKKVASISYKSEPENDPLVEEIIADLNDAIDEGDMADAREILQELEDEVGADDERYKELAKKVEPAKKRSRRRK